MKVEREEGLEEEQLALRFLKHFLVIFWNRIEWNKCIGICTDGAANMARCRSGLAAKVKNIGHSDFLSTHCFSHRENLVVKGMSSELHEVLSDAVKILSEIRPKALHSRLPVKHFLKK